MENNFDIIIIGLGPAGVSAALYTQRGGMNTLLIGEESQALKKTEKIENYYGLEQPLAGSQLFEIGVNQAKNIGATVVNDQVVAVSWDGTYTVKTTRDTFTAKSVIVATGTKRSTPKIGGITRLEGMGVSYCAVCDGFFYRQKEVCVIGSGEYALEEARHLKPIAQKVTILTNGEKPENKSEEFEYIETPIKEIIGNPTVETVVFADGTQIPSSGVFVAIGTAGATDLARKLGAQINGNYIVADENCATNIPGFYAAGDTTGGMLQVAKAVYQGAVAGTNSIKYVRGLKG